MKRIKAACLLQTVCFQPKDACPSELDKSRFARNMKPIRKR